MVRFLRSFVCHTWRIFMFYLSDKTGCIKINKTISVIVFRICVFIERVITAY
jgi:hypothetical protein